MMSFPLALAALVSCLQDPLPTRTDVVVLRSGEELTGTVLVDTPSYLEIRVGSDTTVGIERADVREIRRGETPPLELARAGQQAAPEGGSSAALVPRDAWFVLHDGEGRCVGKLHATLRIGDDAEIRLAQEWEFVTERGRTQVTELETLTRDGAPVSCFYHERTQHPGERDPRDERIVRGEYDGNQLRLVRTNERGSERSVYEIGKGLMFPLALHELLRQRPASLAHGGTRMLFDAGRDELVQTTYRADGRRRVELEGRTLDIREVQAGDGARTNTAWVDGGGQCVRREINGSALVAVASKKDVAGSLVASQAKAFPSAVLREADGRFSLWLPNPVWRFDVDQVAGQVTAQAPLCDASVSALILDQLAPTAHLGTAGDAVERWLKIVCRDFKLRTRQSAEVRRQPGLVLEGTYSRVASSGVVRHDVTVLVSRTPDNEFLALCFAAPSLEADGLRPDFERMVDSLELHPAAVAAEARGGKHDLVRR